MMRRTLFSLIALLLLAWACQDHPPADVILYNARIYTVDSGFTTVEAMAIKDGQVIGTGSSHEVRSLYRAPRNRDMEGRYIYPGLIDAHCHFVGYARGLKQVNLWGTRSFEEVLARIDLFQQEQQMDFIIGRGWDQNDWEEQEFPHKKELDQRYPQTPVVLTRIDGHAILANQAALDYAGISRDTSVEGGILVKDPDGELTGVLIDNAVELIEVPELKGEALQQVLEQAQQHCLAYGLTTLDDAGLEKEEILFLDRLHREGVLKLRIYAMVSDVPGSRQYFMDQGPYQTDRLNVRSVKFYADGALGSRGACLLHPYADEPGNYGLLLDSLGHFQRGAAILAAKGWQMNTHAIGDSANRLILEVYGKYSRDTNRRWRMEHAQLVHPDDFKLFGRYNVVPSVQPTHATSDMYWAGERLGPERLKDAYAYKRLLQEYGKVALGTDFPVEGISTLRTFYAATVRKDAEGYPPQGFQAKDALSREEALRGMTIWAAYANFEEHRKGSLEAGKWADYVIMDTDLMDCAPDEILQARILETVIGGETVFRLEEGSAQ